MEHKTLLRHLATRQETEYGSWMDVEITPYMFGPRSCENS